MSDAPDNFEQRLSAALKGVFAGPSMGMGGAGRDAEILAAARHVGDAAGRQQWRRRVAWAMGVAAAVAVAAGVLWPRGAGYERTGDIRDAFYVAREIKAHGGAGVGRALDGKWDVTGDGVVDEKDVRTLALAAVKVGEGKGVLR